MAIKVTTSGNFEEFIQTMNELAKRTDVAISKGLITISKLTKKNLRRRILMGRGVKGISKGTKLKRALGKHTGEFAPAIPSYPGNNAMTRSGDYANAIKSGKAGKLKWVVGIADREGKFSGGYREAPTNTIRIGDYAKAAEWGFTKSYPMTGKMIAYLRALYGKTTGGKTTRKASRKEISRTITVTVPGRPVWRLTFDEVAPMVPRFFMHSFIQGLNLKGLKVS